MDMQRLETALRNAHAAGDTKAARTLASEIIRLRGQENSNQSAIDPQQSEVERRAAVLDSGAGQVLTGIARAARAVPVIGPLAQKFVNSAIGDETTNAAVELAHKNFEERRPITSTALDVGGAIAGTAPFIAAAPAAFGIGASGLGAATGASGLSGAAIGVADGAARSNGDLRQTALSGAVGGVTGLAGPVAGKAIGAGANAVGGLLGLGNKARASNALGRLVERSGKSVDEIADNLSGAAKDGQAEFTVADALGNSGQRALAGIARQPGDARQEIVEALAKRQSGQTERLTNAIAEGFDAPDTAIKRIASLKELRAKTADVNFAQARNGAGAVDVSPAIQVIDDIVRPGVNQVVSSTDDISSNSIQQVLGGFRNRLTDGRSNLTDFDQVHLLRQDVADQIQKNQGTFLAKQLIKVRDGLDRTLEAASPSFKTANETFAAQSRPIDAVEKGVSAASGRTRAADNIEAFNGLSPNEQSAFKAGFADRLISRVENSSNSPTTNSARPLSTSKLEQEIPVIGGDKAPQLQRRIAREQTQFETANGVLGGSKTADNLADIEDVRSVDPSLIRALVGGRFGDAAAQLGAKSGNLITGQNGKTREELARLLLQSNAAKGRSILSSSQKGAREREAALQGVVRALTVPTALEAAR